MYFPALLTFTSVEYPPVKVPKYTTVRRDGVLHIQLRYSPRGIAHRCCLQELQRLQFSCLIYYSGFISGQMHKVQVFDNYNSFGAISLGVCFEGVTLSNQLLSQFHAQNVCLAA